MTERDRWLVMLRHAKSGYPRGVPDRQRPLTGKGRRNAQAVGEWFRDEGPKLELALCSDALRARHTWEIARMAIDPLPVTQMRPELYGGGPDVVLELARGVEDRTQAVVVIGHEPTMSATVMLLAGVGSDPTALSRMLDKYPTNGVAVLHFTRAWRDLSAGRAALQTFAVPRA
jgi:phosphohistidine phosphatase